MRETFRQSMGWLHTWAGVVFGTLLFAIFWMGTLSVFDKEIDRWMMPATRVAGDNAAIDSLDAVLPRIAGQFDEAARQWWLRIPKERVPLTEFWYVDAADQWQGPYFIHPVTGERIAAQQTEGGTGFFFPFHFNLNLKWANLGYWLVGLAGMAMLALLVSGVVIHRKIFVDLFTFRYERKLPRSSLDLHNLTGVLALPFHFVITLSGLIIFFNIYFPATPDLAYAEADNPRLAFQADLSSAFSRPPAGKRAELASIENMMRTAEEHWEGSKGELVRVYHPGDAASFVSIRRSDADSIMRGSGTGLAIFEGATGELLQVSTRKPMRTTQSFLQGLHFIQFDHWPLRWLYFVLGLSGCVMIATGYIYWLETRRKRHAKLGLPGVRIVEGLTIGSVTGIVIATLAFFVANRLLPLGASFAGYERAALEVWAFYLVWLATFAHAWLRSGRAWREQCWAMAVLALLAPVLNGITTGDHLLKTLLEGYWSVAGMDGLLLAGAGIAVYAARKLSDPSDDTADSKAVNKKARQVTY